MSTKFSIILVALGAHADGAATCYQQEPYLPASPQTKAFVGFESTWLLRFDGVHQVTPSDPFSPGLPASILNQENEGTMPAGETGHIVYFEQGLDKNWRICRVDHWWPKVEDPDERRQKMLTQSQRFASGSKLLEGLVKDQRVLLSSTRYMYDEKNRISQVQIASFSDPDKERLRISDCRRYDDKNRVLLWVNPKSSNKCPPGEPSPSDSWRQFKYADVNGEESVLLHRWHSPKSNGQWIEEWSPLQLDVSPTSIHGNAKVTSQRGVTEIYGSNFGERDNNAANMVVDVFGRWNGSTYYFTKPPVSTSVLENPNELYRYERRRMTRLDSGTRLFELFKPNEHTSRHRYYMIEGIALRHEQLDRKGRIKRIITVNNWRQPRPGPNPDFDDKRLQIRIPRLLAHQVYHRVYDVDANGRPTLVAASWNRSIRNPLKETPLSEADLVFGTPDGKQLWKNREEFDKAFDTSERARHVFTDAPTEDDEEHN